MSALIKNGLELDSTTKLPEFGAAERTEAQQPVDEKPAQIWRLEEEIKALEIQCEADRNRHAEEIQSVRDEVWREALKHAEDDDARRYDRLFSSLTKVEETVERQLQSLEKLSYAIVEAVLQELLGDDDRYADLAKRSITQKITSLRQRFVQRVQVSATDFPSEEDLVSIVRETHLDSVELRAVPNLLQGECRIELNIGEIEFSLPEYWRDLRALLIKRGEGA